MQQNFIFWKHTCNFYKLHNLYIKYTNIRKHNNIYTIQIPIIGKYFHNINMCFASLFYAFGYLLYIYYIQGLYIGWLLLFKRIMLLSWRFTFILGFVFIYTYILDRRYIKLLLLFLFVILVILLFILNGKSVHIPTKYYIN